MICQPTRRSVVGGLITVAAIGSAHAQSQTDAALYELAKKDGEVTWYTSHYNAETAERIRRAFLSKYPDVKLNLLRATTQVAFQRLSQELAAKALQCDVYGTSDVGHYVMLKGKGLLERFTPANTETMLDVFRDLDPDGYFHATSAGMITITHNTDKVKADAAPSSWLGLTDPKWKNQVSVGHPGYSGYAGTWAVVMRKLHGDSFFTKLKDNNPQAGRSIQDTVTMLASGERTVAGGNVASTLESAARGNPIAIGYPEEGGVLVDSPSAIIKGSKHLNAAKLLMEFLSSADVSRIMVKEYGETMHKDVPPNPAANFNKIQHLTVAEITEGIPEVTKLWRNIFGV